MGLLDGLRVLEVSLLAPNMLGMVLADLGADVVKVEQPGRGDYTREVGAARVNRTSLLHLRWNRGKRSLALDLRHPDGVAVFLDLARTSEVVVEGLRAGALARRGLGVEALRAVNPALVYCSLSGFGQTGPYRDLATHGVAYDAYAGHAPPEYTDDGHPTIPHRYIEIGTHAGALYAAVGVLAAVVRARATGRGAILDVAQADAAVAWNAGRLDAALSEVHPPHDRAISMTSAVRYQYYETADGRHILFQASERAFFANFCRAVGRDDLVARDQGADVGEHAVGDVWLRDELASLFRTRTQAEWIELFIEHDVAGGPVYTGSDVLGDRHFQTRARFVEHDHRDVGPLRMLRTPILTDEPDEPLRPAPTVGEHSRDVLSDVLGYDSAYIDDLIRSGAVATP
jgi:crotonobetainyl-CoA:carnitine CoA-transferase CaiB-like acyl-CoA transferase